jgi:hypothetical protein
LWGSEGEGGLLDLGLEAVDLDGGIALAEEEGSDGGGGLDSDTLLRR